MPFGSFFISKVYLWAVAGGEMEWMKEKMWALICKGSEDFSWVEMEFKAVDAVWLSNPADPWTVVRDWRGYDTSLCPLNVKAPP